MMDEVGVPVETPGSKGQTLAEFALTLPILLMLLFGIIEFGRLFQSWVTIQNAARAAARYTVTGNYDEARYSTDLVPCDVDQDVLTRSTYNTQIYTPPDFDLNAFKAQVGNDVFNRIYDYTGNVLTIRVPVWEKPSDPTGNEYLYRTWYGAADCEPDSDSDQDRKDILRLPSIYDVARIGAAGLSLEPSQTNMRAGETQEAALQRFLYTQFANPSPALDVPAYFNITVCSARSRRYGNDYTLIRDNPDDPRPEAERSGRFFTAQDTTVSLYAQGACILKEEPRAVADAADLLDQFGVPMPDAGGSGDRVTLIVTYNHPLITPLPLARYIRLQATRAAVNESFRTTNAQSAFNPTGAQLPPFILPTSTNTATSTSTDIPGITPPPTETPTATFTTTPTAFSCDNITMSPIALTGNTVIVRFTNTNYQDTYITAARVVWLSSELTQAYPTIEMKTFTFGTEIFWLGNDTASPTDTRDADIYPDPDTGDGVVYISASQPFWLYGTEHNGEYKDFEANFTSGFNIVNKLQSWQMAGTEFRFKDPNSNVDCVISPTVPPGAPTPTEAPPGFVPSATFTPDCASSRVNVKLERFDSFLDVVLKVTNNGPIVAPFRGFELVWPAWRSPTLKLESVVVSRSASINASIPGQGVAVWESNQVGGYRPAGVVIGNPNPPTKTRYDDVSAGRWNDGGSTYRVAYTFDPGPNSVSYIYLNFAGSGNGSLENAVGAWPSDFNGTRFFITCGLPTGPGGGGGGASGEIFLSENVTPLPTQPPIPTNTPGPTRTPTITPSPAPPTNTWTPAPFTNTPLPSPTQAPTNTPAPTRTPTPRTGGCTDGC